MNGFVSPCLIEHVYDLVFPHLTPGEVDALRTLGVSLNARTQRWDKQPYVAGCQVKATTDAETIRGFWGQYPDALPGLALGKAGLLALDANRHGGPDSVDAFHDLIAQYGLPDGVVRVLTAGGTTDFLTAKSPPDNETAAPGVVTRDGRKKENLAQTVAQDTPPASSPELPHISAAVAWDFAPRIEPLEAEWQERIRDWRDRAAEAWTDITEAFEEQAPEFDDIEWPEPNVGDEDPESLFDSRRSYLDQMKAYRRHKGRGGGGDGGDDDGDGT